MINMFLCSLQIWFWCLPYFCLDIMEVVIGFSMLKSNNKTQKRTRRVIKSKHVKKKETCRKKVKERRKKTEVKREKGPKLHAAWWWNIKVEINFILFIEKLLEAFFCFSSISVYSLGGPIVQISIYFFYEIYLSLFTPLQQKKNLSVPHTSIYA